MKIYTKTGDKGETGLLGGERVKKNNPRLKAYGAADELNSNIGYLISLTEDEPLKKELKAIQKTLFTLGSLLAAPPDSKNFKTLPKLESEDIVRLESIIDEREDILPPLTAFILPGGSPAAAYCQVVRAVCRRFERELVEMRVGKVDFPEVILIYANRLSDYFFVLSRFINYKMGIEDELL